MEAGANNKLDTSLSPQAPLRVPKNPEGKVNCNPSSFQTVEGEGKVVTSTHSYTVIYSYIPQLKGILLLSSSLLPQKRTTINIFVHMGIFPLSLVFCCIDMVKVSLGEMVYSHFSDFGENSSKLLSRMALPFYNSINNELICLFSLQKLFSFFVSFENLMGMR